MNQGPLIKDLPSMDRPREKIINRGVKSLSNVELIAALLGSASRGQNIMNMASNLANLLDEKGLEINIEDLSQIDGVGVARAAQILASFELARRHFKNETFKISNPNDCFALLKFIQYKKQEHFVTITLSGANEVIEVRTITVGLLNQSQIHPREVYADALTDRAASIIIAHNHPSGSLEPSSEDISVTQTLTEAGELLGINLLDHVIVSPKGFISLKEKGFI